MILACRDIKKGRDLCDELIKDNPSAKVEPKLCDLSSFASIRQLVIELDSEPQIDILVNNGAVMLIPLTKTVDGLEANFQINYLGHYMLTLLLLEKLKASPQARVVNLVSSSYSRQFSTIISFFNHLLIEKKLELRKKFPINRSEEGLGSD